MHFVIGDVRSGFDSRAHPCTVTLGGEVEQGRVNDAARVGQNADLVVAPLFLSLIFLSQLLLLWFSWDFFTFCQFALDVFSKTATIMLLSISLRFYLHDAMQYLYPPLLSLCNGGEKLSGMSASPV